MGRPWRSAGQRSFPTVSRVSRIHRVSSSLAASESVSWTTLVSTRMVTTAPGRFRSSATSHGGMAAGLVPSAIHSWTTFAIFVVLHTTMKTGGRVRPAAVQSSSVFLQCWASSVSGTAAYLRIASGFGLPRRPPRSAAVSCGRIHSQML